MHFRLLAILPLLCLLCAPALAAPAQVALLHSDRSSTPWTDAVAAGLAEGLGADGEVRRVFVRPESESEDAYDDMFEALSAELAGYSAQYVVADGEIAFAFARKYGPLLFPNAPVVACSLPEADAGDMALCTDCAAIPMGYDIPASVDLIFAMRPATRLVVAVADNAEESRPLMDAANKAMGKYADRAQVLFPGFEPGNDRKLDLDLLGETLASVPSDGVVLVLDYSEEPDETPVSDGQLEALFREKIASPVFVMRDAWPDSGVVGGLMISGVDAGRDAAGLVRRALGGEPIREMLPRPTAPSLRFDGTALARFGLQVPEQAGVVNTPQAVEESPALPVTGLAWGFGLAAVVGLFVYLRRYRP
ncbi:hypothetical protein [Pseudodesulfovibrio indicus]|uniref:hypothetical protein n=1 Tax=Pseudodesulfovibrio indicus TaxID=1716143 RepID=UPI0029314002|nr:hypothetical protein [Pseudodesulfovibrio indicus]